MALRSVNGDIAIASAARAAGTVTSGSITPPGASSHVVLLVHVSATTGTPTLNVSLEQSNDGTSWSAIAGSSTVQLTAAGNAVANAVVTDDYVRVTATVAGTTPNVTFSATVLVFAE